VIPASRHPVPVADSQLNSNFADSGDGCETTGLALVTARSNSGTLHPPRSNAGIVHSFIADFIPGRPQTSTNPDNSMKGIHAPTIGPLECLLALALVAGPAAPAEVNPRSTLAPASSSSLSSSSALSASAVSRANLHTRFGCQNLRNATVTASEATAAAMSTRLLSTLFDHKNWADANEIPTTRIAGSTSNVSAHPTKERTSQNATITAVIGKILPIIALKSDSGRPDTAARVWTGVPIAPHATGAVLAIKFSTAAWNGSNPSPIMKAPAIATGAPNPAEPSINEPKQKATNRSCSRRSGVIAAIDSFIISNWPVSTEMS